MVKGHIIEITTRGQRIQQRGGGGRSAVHEDTLSTADVRDHVGLALGTAFPIRLWLHALLPWLGTLALNMAAKLQDL